MFRHPLFVYVLERKNKTTFRTKANLAEKLASSFNALRGSPRGMRESLSDAGNSFNSLPDLVFFILFGYFLRYLWIHVTASVLFAIILDFKDLLSY
jgi:hypothetical protein